jgi:hypothetical protein
VPYFSYFAWFKCFVHVNKVCHAERCYILRACLSKIAKDLSTNSTRYFTLSITLLEPHCNKKKLKRWNLRVKFSLYCALYMMSGGITPLILKLCKNLSICLVVRTP